MSGTGIGAGSGAAMRAAARAAAVALALLLPGAAAAFEPADCSDGADGRYHVLLYSGRALAVDPAFMLRIKAILDEGRRQPFARPADEIGCPGNPLVVEGFKIEFEVSPGSAGPQGWHPLWLSVSASEPGIRSLNRSQVEITCGAHPETRETVDGVTVCRVPREGAALNTWPATFRLADLPNADGTPLDIHCTPDWCRADLLLEEGLSVSWGFEGTRPEDAGFIAANRQIVATVRGWRMHGLDRADLRDDPLFGSGQ